MGSPSSATTPESACTPQRGHCVRITRLPHEEHLGISRGGEERASRVPQRGPDRGVSSPRMVQHADVCLLLNPCTLSGSCRRRLLHSQAQTSTSEISRLTLSPSIESATR